jgi:hypothetical protein
MKEPCIEDSDLNIINSKVVAMKHVEAVIHHSETKSAAAISCVPKIILIEVNFSKVKDRVVSSKSRKWYFKTSWGIFNVKV